MCWVDNLLWFNKLSTSNIMMKLKPESDTLHSCQEVQRLLFLFCCEFIRKQEGEWRIEIFILVLEIFS